MINKDGTRYEGEWVAGVKHGKGRMEYAENFFYNGYWKEGMVNLFCLSYYKSKFLITIRKVLRSRKISDTWRNI